MQSGQHTRNHWSWGKTMTEIIRQFINILVSILYLAIFARVIMSWLPLGSMNPIMTVIYQITEPILAPLRRVIPRLGPLDVTPMIAIIILGIIQSLAASLR